MFALLKDYFPGEHIKKGVSGEIRHQLINLVNQFHSRGLVHLDLFLQNIIVSDYKVKLIELGRAFRAEGRRFDLLKKRDLENLAFVLG